MIYRVPTIDDLLRLSHHLARESESGVLFVDQRSTLSPGAISTNGMTYGFNEQQSFSVLLQTKIGAYYFEGAFQDQEDIDKVSNRIKMIGQIFPIIPVSELNIDRNKLVGTISFQNEE